MQPTALHIHVLMPDDSKAAVTYYCSDKKLSAKEKENFTQLFIQLHDCICIEKIEKSFSNKKNELERLVHNKVINAKGHLC